MSGRVAWRAAVLARTHGQRAHNEQRRSEVRCGGQRHGHGKPVGGEATAETIPVPRAGAPYGVNSTWPALRAQERRGRVVVAAHRGNVTRLARRGLFVKHACAVLRGSRP